VVGVTGRLTARFSAVDLVRKGAEALGGKGGGGGPTWRRRAGRTAPRRRPRSRRSRRRSAVDARPQGSGALAQEDVVGRVRLALEVASGLARTFERPAHGFHALHGRSRPTARLAAMLGYFKFQPRDVVGAAPGRPTHDLADDGAAVRQLPIRARIVPPDRLAVADEGRDRLAEGPYQLSARIRLALVDLRAFACTWVTTFSSLAAIASGSFLGQSPGSGEDDGRNDRRQVEDSRCGSSCVTSVFAVAIAGRAATAAAHPPPAVILTSTALRRHRLLQVVVDLVEEAGGREPLLVGADQEREVLGHEARLDRVNADLLQGVRELRQRGIVVELGAWASPRVQAKIDAMELVEVSRPF